MAVTFSTFARLSLGSTRTTRFFFFFFNDTATTEIYTLSLHDALPICMWVKRAREIVAQAERRPSRAAESGSGVDWTALAADDAIEPARFATWVFRYEDRGERIKR